MPERSWTPLKKWLMGLLAGALLVALAALIDSYAGSNRPSTNDISQAAGEEVDPTPAFEEARFRISQVDDVLAQAKLNLDRSQTLTDEDLLALFASAPRLTVVAELGGIYSVPLDDDATVWIGSSGYGKRHLPRQRGYKDSTFMESNLKDIWREYHRAMCRAEPTSAQLVMVTDLFQALQDAAEPNGEVRTLSTVGNRYELQRWREGANNAEVDAVVTALGTWIRSVESAWTAVKTSPLLSSFENQLPDREVYESNCG